MKVATFYIIDRRTKSIVNAVEAPSLDAADRVRRSLVDGEHCYLRTEPPMEMLEAYRYWYERP